MQACSCSTMALSGSCHADNKLDVPIYFTPGIRKRWRANALMGFDLGIWTVYSALPASRKTDDAAMCYVRRRNSIRPCARSKHWRMMQQQQRRRWRARTRCWGALAGEEARWTEQSKAFDDRIQRLTGRYHNPLSAYSSHFKTSKPGSAHCQMAFGAASFTVIKDGLFAISIGYMGALATDVLDS